MIAWLSKKKVIYFSRYIALFTITTQYHFSNKMTKLSRNKRTRRQSGDLNMQQRSLSFLFPITSLTITFPAQCPVDWCFPPRHHKHIHNYLSMDIICFSYIVCPKPHHVVMGDNMRVRQIDTQLHRQTDRQIDKKKLFVMIPYVTCNSK